MTTRVINGEGDLFALEDGTIIVWNRVPGDSTSAALAFVHQERDPDEPDTDPVIWISPGGWAPQSPGSAGINYPATALGTVSEIIGSLGAMNSAYLKGVASAQLRYEDNRLTAMTTLDSGGTWAREKALECASRFWASQPGAAYTMVLGTAEAFEAWLNQPANELGSWTNDAITKKFVRDLRAIIDNDRQTAQSNLQRITAMIEAWGLHRD